MKKTIRTRFTATSSQGLDLDSIRTALVSSFFAKKHLGEFILRINDLSIKKFSSQDTKIILNLLSWLKIPIYQDPVLTSTRTEAYQQDLQELIDNQKVYRCFCPTDILERKREQQIMMGKSSRYDRSCLLFSQEKIKQKVTFGLPFVWRLKINELQILTARDLDRGSMDFSMAQISDLPLTNHDGSATNLFAQFVDDWKLGITHLIYSKKFLGDSAHFVALYDAFSLEAPTFWHLSIVQPNTVITLTNRNEELSAEALIQLQEHCFKLCTSKSN